MCSKYLKPHILSERLLNICHREICDILSSQSKRTNYAFFVWRVKFLDTRILDTGILAIFWPYFCPSSQHSWTEPSMTYILIFIINKWPSIMSNIYFVMKFWDFSWVSFSFLWAIPHSPLRYTHQEWEHCSQWKTMVIKDISSVMFKLSVSFWVLLPTSVFRTPLHCNNARILKSYFIFAPSTRRIGQDLSVHHHPIKMPL